MSQISSSVFRQMFARVGAQLQANGVKVSGGTIVDATLIAAPPSTKNEGKARIPRYLRSRKTSNGILYVARMPLNGTVGFADVLRRLWLLVA